MASRYQGFGQGVLLNLMGETLLGGWEEWSLTHTLSSPRAAVIWTHFAQPAADAVWWPRVPEVIQFSTTSPPMGLQEKKGAQNSYTGLALFVPNLFPHAG